MVKKRGGCDQVFRAYSINQCDYTCRVYAESMAQLLQSNGQGKTLKQLNFKG